MGTTEVSHPRMYASAIGELPRFLPETIRGIRNAQSLFNGEKSIQLKDIIVRLCRKIFNAPSISQVLYTAAEELYPVHLEDYKDPKPEELSRFFSPDELGALLALLFLSRRLRDACPSDDWQLLFARMRTHIALGRIAGELYSSVGPGNGMLLAGLRYISVGTFLATSPEKFHSYPQSLRRTKVLFDTAKEREIFGVSHREVAAELARVFGFGAITASTLIVEDLRFSSNQEQVATWLEVQRLTEEFQLKGSEVVDTLALKMPELGPQKISYYKQAIEDVLSNVDCSHWLQVAVGEVADSESETVESENDS